MSDRLKSLCSQLVLSWVCVSLALSACKQTATEPAPKSRESALAGAQSAPASTVRAAEVDATAHALGQPRVEPELRQAGEIVYLEMLTAGADETQRLPLIVAIHGLGDRPERFVGLVREFDLPARIALPRGLDPHHDGYSWFPIGNMKNVELIAQGIERAADKLAKAIVQIRDQRPTLGRAIVTGFSQGGMLSFALAALHPQLIAEAFPLAGYLPAPLVTRLPDSGGFPEIIALHGEADPVVPFAQAKRSVALLKARGVPVELRAFPGVQHSPSAAMGFELYRLLRAACQRTVAQ